MHINKAAAMGILEITANRKMKKQNNIKRPLPSSLFFNNTRRA